MKYHNITKEDMNNGDGLRVVLWVAGCEHHCKGCQNPLTWSVYDGIIFDSKAKEEIFDQLSKDYISGITLSGGDPLHTKNRADITFLCEEIKRNFPNKTIWLYTGYCWEDIKNEKVINFIDVIVDGRFIQELADTKYHWAGSTNQRVIDVQSSIKTNKVVLWK